MMGDWEPQCRSATVPQLRHVGATDDHPGQARSVCPLGCVSVWECCRTVSVLGRPIEWRRLYFGRVLVHARVRQSWTSHDSQGQREGFIAQQTCELWP